MSRLALSAAVLATFVASPAAAQSSITVGRIDSEKECRLYQQSAGRVAAIATPYAVGVAASWRTWLVRDCVDHFASLRQSLQAALAAAGGAAGRRGGGRYTLDARISDVTGGGGPAPYVPDPGPNGYAVASRRMGVSIDVTVRDGRGAIVHGALITKAIETGSSVSVDGIETSSDQSGQGLYAKLQQQVALAVARDVAFHFDPLRVSKVEGKSIRLNHGAPLVELGQLVQVDTGGTSMVRYRVTSAVDGAAIARHDGGGEPGRVMPGAVARLAEVDSAADNSRRFEKVELP